MLAAYIQYNKYKNKKCTLRNPTPNGCTLTLWCIISTEFYSQNVGSLYPIQIYLYYKMSVEFINWYWIYSANIWGMYVIWRVSVRPSGAGLGNMSGQECTFSFMCTGQLPTGQIPLRTTSPRTSSPGQVPLWTSSPQGELVRGAVVRGEVVC